MSSADSEMIILVHNFLPCTSSQWLGFDGFCLGLVLYFDLCFGLDFFMILMFGPVKGLGFLKLSFCPMFELIALNRLI